MHVTLIEDTVSDDHDKKINLVNNSIQKLMFYSSDEIIMLNINEDVSNFVFINIGGDRHVTDAGAVAVTEPEREMDTKTVTVRRKSGESRAESATAERSSSLTTGLTTAGRSPNNA